MGGGCDAEEGSQGSARSPLIHRGGAHLDVAARIFATHRTFFIASLAVSANAKHLELVNKFARPLQVLSHEENATEARRGKERLECAIQHQHDKLYNYSQRLQQCTR